MSLIFHGVLLFSLTFSFAVKILNKIPHFTVVLFIWKFSFISATKLTNWFIFVNTMNNVNMYIHCVNKGLVSVTFCAILKEIWNWSYPDNLKGSLNSGWDKKMKRQTWCQFTKMEQLRELQTCELDISSCKHPERKNNEMSGKCHMARWQTMLALSS